MIRLTIYPTTDETQTTPEKQTTNKTVENNTNASKTKRNEIYSGKSRAELINEGCKSCNNCNS